MSKQINAFKQLFEESHQEKEVDDDEEDSGAHGEQIVVVVVLLVTPLSQTPTSTTQNPPHVSTTGIIPTVDRCSSRPQVPVASRGTGSRGRGHRSGGQAVRQVIRVMVGMETVVGVVVCLGAHDDVECLHLAFLRGRTTVPVEVHHVSVCH